jgi:hypothetical protein
MIGKTGTTRRVHRPILATAHYFSSINTCHVPSGFPIKKGDAELSGMLSFDALTYILDAFTSSANPISIEARKRERP